MALNLLTTALARGHADSVSLNTTLSACEKASRWELALHLLISKYSWQINAVGYGSFLTSCRQSARWMEALAILNNTTLDAIGLTSAVEAVETSGQPAGSVLLQGLLRQTSKQLAFACTSTSAASRRAHAASTGGLDMLDAYGLLSGLSVARTRVREPALRDLQTFQVQPLPEQQVLQSLCDLGRPCTRDVLERLASSEGGWQEDARVVLEELLDASPGMPLPVQAAAQKIATWTSLDLRGPDWQLCGAPEIAFGARRGEKNMRLMRPYQCCHVLMVNASCRLC